FVEEEGGGVCRGSLVEEKGGNGRHPATPAPGLLNPERLRVHGDEFLRAGDRVRVLAVRAPPPRRPAATESAVADRLEPATRVPELNDLRLRRDVQPPQQTEVIVDQHDVGSSEQIDRAQRVPAADGAGDPEGVAELVSRA